MKTIICTGSDGYLGWSIVSHLIEKNKAEIIVCVDNYSKRRIMEQSNLQTYNSTLTVGQKIELYNLSTKKHNLIFEFGDLTDEKFIEKLIIKYQPELIIHCSGQSSETFSTNNTQSVIYTHYNNTISLLNILSGIKIYSPKTKLIKFCILKESPNTFYEAVKDVESNYAKILSKKWKIDVIDFGIQTVYGIYNSQYKDERMNTQIAYDSYFGTTVNQILIQTIKDKKLIIYGDENVSIYITEINDLLRGIEKVLKEFRKIEGYKKIAVFSEKIKIHNIIKISKRELEKKNIIMQIELLKDKVSKIPMTNHISFIDNTKKFEECCGNIVSELLSMNKSEEVVA